MNKRSLFFRTALVHFTGSDELTLFEIGEAVNELRETLSPNADLILGATTDPAMAGRTLVLLIITGIGAKPVKNIMKAGAEVLASSNKITPTESEFDELDLPTFLAVGQCGSYIMKKT